MPGFRLSKTTYLQGRQCPLRLWLRSQGEEEPLVDGASDAVEDYVEQAELVERIAERRFPGGVLVGGGEAHGSNSITWAAERAVAQSLVQDPNVPALFQMPLSTDDLTGRTDILARARDGWIVYEIKASSEVKPLFYWDLAFQWLLAEACGLPVVGARVLHLDKNYLYLGGEADPWGLLVDVDCTAEVSNRLDEVRTEIDELLAVVRRSAPPQVNPGRHCFGQRDDPNGRRPSDCGHLRPSGHCETQVPENWSLRLPRLSAAKKKYVSCPGNWQIEDLDPDDGDANWTELQERVIRAVQCGQPFVDRERLQQELATLRWPVSYMDFEFEPACAVPPFPGMRPNQKLPFQWSVKIQEAPAAALRDATPFLHAATSDPRGDFVAALLEALPDRGSIVVHFQAAESSVLNLYSEWLEGRYRAECQQLIGRMFDTCELSRQSFYDPRMQCSFSIKKLAPALLGQGYEHLTIQDGMEAVRQWRRLICAETSDAERNQIRNDLIVYCGQDTELMHAIVERYRELAG